jgi:hypothetical protein
MLHLASRPSLFEYDCQPFGSCITNQPSYISWKTLAKQTISTVIVTYFTFSRLHGLQGFQSFCCTETKFVASQLWSQFMVNAGSEIVTVK